jgi:hypothetical protein
MRSRRSVDAALYRSALHLCPPAFRREFSAEMIRDAADARRDPHVAGIGWRLWIFRLHMGRDLAASIVRQWLHTGLPAIVLLAGTVTSLAVASLARVWSPRLFTLPAAHPQRDLIVLELLVAVLLFVIVSTVLFTSWIIRRMTPPIARRRPR